MDIKTKYSLNQMVYVVQLNESPHKKLTVRSTWIEQVNTIHKATGERSSGGSEHETWYKVAMFSNQLSEEVIYATEQEAIEAVIDGIWLQEKPLRNDYEYLVARKK